MMFLFSAYRRAAHINCGCRNSLSKKSVKGKTESSATKRCAKPTERRVKGARKLPIYPSSSESAFSSELEYDNG
jgi:hypothetical protein